MKKYAVNSLEYWNSRFETSDWEDSSGREQSEYFAKTAMGMIPEWLIRDAAKYEYSLCDLGCAEGDAIPFLKECFPASEIVGADFAEKQLKRRAININLPNL